MPLQPLADKDLPKIRKEMQKIIRKNLPFIREELSVEEARRRIEEAGESYKLEILEGIVARWVYHGTEREGGALEPYTLEILEDIVSGRASSL